STAPVGQCYEHLSTLHPGSFTGSAPSRRAHPEMLQNSSVKPTKAAEMANVSQATNTFQKKTSAKSISDGSQETSREAASSLPELRCGEGGPANNVAPDDGLYRNDPRTRHRCRRTPRCCCQPRY